MIAHDGSKSVQLTDSPAIGVHAVGKTCVKTTVNGRFAVCGTIPRDDGSLRLIAVHQCAVTARRHNFSIHGDILGE